MGDSSGSRKRYKSKDDSLESIIRRDKTAGASWQAKKGRFSFAECTPHSRSWTLCYFAISIRKLMKSMRKIPLRERKFIRFVLNVYCTASSNCFIRQAVVPQWMMSLSTACFQKKQSFHLRKHERFRIMRMGAYRIASLLVIYVLRMRLCLSNLCTFSHNGKKKVLLRPALLRLIARTPAAK